MKSREVEQLLVIRLPILFREIDRRRRHGQDDEHHRQEQLRAEAERFEIEFNGLGYLAGKSTCKVMPAFNSTGRCRMSSPATQAFST